MDKARQVTAIHPAQSTTLPSFQPLEMRPVLEKHKRWVYCIQEGDGGPFKFGFASNLASRFSGIQTGNPRVLHLRGAVPGGRKVEGDIHSKLFAHRVRGEWFSYCLDTRTVAAEMGASFARERPAKPDHARLRAAVVQAGLGRLSA